MAKLDAVDMGNILGSKMDHLSLTESGSHRCVVCREPAHLHCNACSYTEGDIDEHKLTWYCSKDCQEQDRLSHKSHCSEMSDFNQLVRAAHLVQKVFYHYRKLWFDVPVKRIVFKGENIRIHQGDAKDKMLFEFPTKLVKSREVEEALLSFCACDDGLGRMQNLTALVLSGMLEFRASYRAR
jgi:MYND finger